MNKSKLRIISKVGLLLVAVGFFMPVSCDMSGFEFTKAFLINTDAPINSMIEHPFFTGLMGLIMFLASCVGVILMVMLIQEKDIAISYDWVVTLITVTAGLVAFFGLKDVFERSFQAGGYFIIIGWTVSLLCMILTKFEDS